MTYAVLKAVHLLCVVAWVGGMFFAHVCLRPALAALDAPTRVQLMHAALRRFLDIVVVASFLVLATGVAMIVIATSAPRRAGIAFNMPLDWTVMVVLGLLMIGIFIHVRAVLFVRLRRAVEAGQWPAGGAALAAIRAEVLVNLVLGIVIVVVTQIGAAS